MNVLVTTEHKGVFYGTLKRKSIEVPQSGKVTLHDVRMVVYWPSSNYGILGLAADGPKAGAKVTPTAPAMSLVGVTGITKCSKKSIKAFEQEEIWGT